MKNLLFPKGSLPLPLAVRKLDDLGRIVLPVPCCKALHLKPGSEVKVYQLKDGVLLRPAKATCNLCGCTTGLVSIRGQHLCGCCLESIQALAGRTPDGDPL